MFYQNIRLLIKYVTGGHEMTADNISIKTKVCSKCSIEKYITEFHKRKGSPDGTRNDCKKCAIARVTKYASLNRDKRLAYLKEWREKNIEEVREKEKIRARKYRAEFPERRRIINQKYSKNNKEKIAESGKRWKKENPDAVRLMAHRRRCRKGSEVLSKGIIKKLYKLQKGKCPCCSNNLGDDYHLDHIMPLYLGGDNTDNNVQLLRSVCNLNKHAKHPIDYMQSKGFLL